MNLKSLLRLTNVASPILRSYKTATIPELAKIRYNVKRGSYAVVGENDIKCFESIVGANHVQQEDLQKYNIDFMHAVRGESKVVLLPGSVEEISEILKYCNEKRIAVCPQGGNTGLVGGSVPVCDEIVLSMGRLNKLLSIDEVTGVLKCEAGCILENLDIAAREKGLIVPLDLGAKSSCHIGGNVSTNAGGLRVLRYGNLHGSVLGVEAVLANGNVVDLMSGFKKDNTGYHLKHMFIGSEGTLGVITKVSMLCPPESSSVNVAFLGVDSFEDVTRIFHNARRHLSEILSSCEMIDAVSFDLTVKHFNLQSPIDKYPFYMLIETSGSNESHDLEKMNKFLENGMNSGLIVDGAMTGEPHKVQQIWKLRELVPVALVEAGHCFKYDISLPLKEFYNIVHVMRERVGDKATAVCGYGHLGDSNLHLNIACPEFTDEIYKLVEPFVYEYTAKVKGSVSAEHGIGFLKTKYLKYTKSCEAVNLMNQMKNILDPNGILNPYKVLS